MERIAIFLADADFETFDGTQSKCIPLEILKEIAPSRTRSLQ